MPNACLTRFSNDAGLDAPDRAELDRLFSRPRQVKANQRLGFDGPDPRYVYAVLEGFAYRGKMLADGMRQIVELIIPGDLTDYGLNLHSETDHTLTTLTACLVVDIPSQAVDSLMRRSEALFRVMRRAARVEEAILRERIVSLGRRPADQRLAHMVCELQVRLLNAGMSEGRSFDFPLTQDEVADMLGLSQVHVNRQMRKLREYGLIEWSRGRMSVLDSERLHAFAQFDPGYLQLQ